MKVKKLTLNASSYPDKLKDIPTPPEQLFYLGADPVVIISRLGLRTR